MLEAGSSALEYCRRLAMSMMMPEAEESLHSSSSDDSKSHDLSTSDIDENYYSAPVVRQIFRASSIILI
jgi:hypothetical protein